MWDAFLGLCDLGMLIYGHDFNVSVLSFARRQRPDAQHFQDDSRNDEPIIELVAGRDSFRNTR